MKNKLITLGLTVLILGAVAGIHYRVPLVVAGVCVGLALLAGVSGLRMVVTRTAVIATSDGLDANKEYHTGLSAQLYGVLFLMLSVPLAAFGVAYWLHGGDPPGALVEPLVRSPLVSGLAIVAAGTMIALCGLTRLVPGNETFTETRVRPGRRRIAGVCFVGLGLAIATVGVVRATAPGTLTTLRDAGIARVLELAE
ncbi:MAG: hypothetical protein K0S86_225 [Geminicoccaceae bacterium]|jgi:hypothetical protein|nr:hypothetical protein [Geminicoccaceae bacterium]